MQGPENKIFAVIFADISVSHSVAANVIPENPYQRERLSTIDLLAPTVRTRLNQLL
jgi:hypothetical protein